MTKNIYDKRKSAKKVENPVQPQPGKKTHRTARARPARKTRSTTQDKHSKNGGKKTWKPKKITTNKKKVLSHLLISRLIPHYSRLMCLLFSFWSICNPLSVNSAGPLGYASSYSPSRNASQQNPHKSADMVCFGSALVFLLYICNVYLTPKSWHHLLTREESWNQSFDKDMECLWSLARLLAKEKTDMNTHQKIASINMQLDSTPRWPAWPHSLWHFGSYIKISGNRKCSEAQYKG